MTGSTRRIWASTCPGSMSTTDRAVLRILELHDELQCGIEPVRSAQAGDRRGDPGVEVVLLVQRERLQQALLGAEVAVERRSRNVCLGGHVGQLQVPVSAARQHDMGGVEDAAPSRPSASAAMLTTLQSLYINDP